MTIYTTSPLLAEIDNWSWNGKHNFTIAFGATIGDFGSTVLNQYASTSSVMVFSQAYQGWAQWVIQQYESVVNIHFDVSTTPATADMRVGWMTAYDRNIGGMTEKAYDGHATGNVWLDFGNAASGPYFVDIFAHELLHFLGLKHPDEGNVQIDPFQTHDGTFSLMNENLSVTPGSPLRINDVAALAKIFGSTYHLDPADYIVGNLYAVAYNRAPDKDGILFQVAAKHDGLSMLDMARNFLGGAEGQALYGNKSDAEFVTAVYHNGLAREPDQAGYDVQLNALQHGMERAQLLLNVVGAPELHERLGDWMWL